MSVVLLQVLVLLRMFPERLLCGMIEFATFIVSGTCIVQTACFNILCVSVHSHVVSIIEYLRSSVLSKSVVHISASIY